MLMEAGHQGAVTMSVCFLCVKKPKKEVLVHGYGLTQELAHNMPLI